MILFFKLDNTNVDGYFDEKKEIEPVNLALTLTGTTY